MASDRRRRSIGSGGRNRSGYSPNRQRPSEFYGVARSYSPGKGPDPEIQISKTFRRAGTADAPGWKRHDRRHAGRNRPFSGPDGPCLGDAGTLPDRPARKRRALLERTSRGPAGHLWRGIERTSTRSAPGRLAPARCVSLATERPLYHRRPKGLVLPALGLSFRLLAGHQCSDFRRRFRKILTLRPGRGERPTVLKLRSVRKQPF